MDFDYQSHLHEIANISELGIVILDENREVVWCNETFANWTSIEMNMQLGISWLSLPLEPLSADGLTYQLLSPKGVQQILLHWQSPLPSKPILCCHFFKLLPSSKPIKALAKLPFALPRRPNWSEYLDYEVSRSRRYLNPLCVAKVKLVVFSDIQAPAERRAVDELFVNVLKDELRWADMVSESGEGEPLLVLPETAITDVQGLQKKISHAFKKQIETLYAALDYHILWGVAEWQKGDNAHSLLQTARDQLVEELRQLKRSLS